MDYKKHLKLIRAFILAHAFDIAIVDIGILSASYVISYALNQNISGPKSDLENKLNEQKELKGINSDEFASGYVKYIFDNRRK